MAETRLSQPQREILDPMDSSEEEQAGRRRHVRKPVQLVAVVRVGTQTVRAVAENISPGGAFLCIDLPPEQTELLASIALPHGKEVYVLARVRWRRKHPAPGVGISFDEFLEASRGAKALAGIRQSA